MKKLAVVVVLLVSLFGGCSSPKETETVCTANTNGMLETMTYYAKGDEINKFVDTIEFKAEDFFEGEELDDILNSEPYESQEAKGILYKEYVEDGVGYMVLEVDFSLTTNEVLYSYGLIREADLDAKYISLKITLEGLDDSFSCSTK